jgi:hypothetical protein
MFRENRKSRHRQANEIVAKLGQTWAQKWVFLP